MSNKLPVPQDADGTAFNVSTINIGLASVSRKTIHSITIKLKKKDGSDVNVHRSQLVSAGDVHEEKFDRPLGLDPKGHVAVLVNCSWPLAGSCGRRQVANVPIDIDLRGEHWHESQGIRSYRNKARNVEVVVIGRWLVHQSSTGDSRDVSDILESCPRFRLLVIGNSGVGKSSLIRSVFGVKEVSTSDNGRGIADIDKEFVSPTNERFVVHDSLGFEAGDQQNMAKVEDFVIQRKVRPQLTDQLHAVWLCLEIPHAGGRLLEGGVEMFLQRRKQILGEIPLVAVLTKVDKLDAQLELDHPDEDVQQHRSRYLDEKCFQPLRGVAGSDTPCVIVSVQDGYSDSLSNLVTTTLQSMTSHNVHEDPRAVATIAQRVSIKEKIELSVQVGKKKYRPMLIWSNVFGESTFQGYLQDIRKDVVTIWNFNDPEQCLMKNNIVQDLLRADNLGNASQSLLGGKLLWGAMFAARTLGPVLGLLLGSFKTTLPITDIPNADGQASYGITLASTENHAKILLGYIVDLISAMQIIFLLASGSHVNSKTVTVAVRAYEEPRKIVHAEVEKFTGNTSRDRVMDEVERLIWRYSIGDHEIERLRKEISDVAAGL